MFDRVTVALCGAVVLAVLRMVHLEDAPPIELTFFNVFKDVAHVWVGGMLGGVLFSKDASTRAWLCIASVVVIVVECLAAGATISEHGLK